MAKSKRRPGPDSLWLLETKPQHLNLPFHQDDTQLLRGESLKEIRVLLRANPNLTPSMASYASEHEKMKTVSSDSQTFNVFVSHLRVLLK